MHDMNALAKKQLEQLARSMAERKSRLLEEIRQALARTGRERYADLVGEAGDAGDESAASLLRDVAEAGVVRDIGEVRDIVAAEERVATGRYGICIDCGEDIGYERLKAYPSAKRCLSCQQHREKTRKPSQYTGR
jgi:RNA polymerase-binding transcription factor DksA